MDNSNEASEFGVYIVAAKKEDETVYWVAAAPRDGAVTMVHNLLPPGWSVSLTDRRMSPDRLYGLKLKPNTARKLKKKH
jgi:hypothetical protein